MRAVPGGTAGAVLFTFVDAARCYVDLAILILHPKTPCGPRCGVQQRPDQRFYPQRVHRPTAAVGAPCDARLLRQRGLRWHYGTMHLRCFPPWPGMRRHLPTYTNANTCSGDGVVDGSGGCTCNADFAGSSCQFDTTAYCNGNGVFSIGSEDLPVCSCTAGVGDRCYSDAVTCTWTLPPVRHRVRHRHLPCYSIRLHYALCTMLRASTWGGV